MANEKKTDNLDSFYKTLAEDKKTLEQWDRDYQQWKKAVPSQKKPLIDPETKANKADSWVDRWIAEHPERKKHKKPQSTPIEQPKYSEIQQELINNRMHIEEWPEWIPAKLKEIRDSYLITQWDIDLGIFEKFKEQLITALEEAGHSNEEAANLVEYNLLGSRNNWQRYHANGEFYAFSPKAFKHLPLSKTSDVQPVENYMYRFWNQRIIDFRPKLIDYIAENTKLNQEQAENIVDKYLIGYRLTTSYGYQSFISEDGKDVYRNRKWPKDIDRIVDKYCKKEGWER